MSAASHAPAITGILVPHMVPLDAKGRIDEDELFRYVEWLVDRGVHGLYPNGSTGEFLRFTVEERQKIVRIVCKAAAGRVPVVAGAAEGTAAETIRACEHCLEAGARAVAVVAPYYYRLSAESVEAYFREIGAHSPIDVTLYHIPMLASPIEIPVVRRLAEEFPRIIGIKDSSGDISHMQRLIAAVRPVRPGFSFLTGWDPALTSMLLVGCSGATVATSGIMPEMTRAVYDMAMAGDVTGAMRLQPRIIELFDMAMQGADFPEGYRVAASCRGFRMGPSRQPASAKQLADRSALEERLTALLETLGMNRARPSDAVVPVA
ncbi:MAG: dihydrodipicolinate synthase family protein [Planctomycetota bacterium]|nr:MAG: dihydrodipicolinate synthase family protein [Planctomycetota bacterium]